MSDLYSKKQENCGLKIGDKVKVIKSADKNDNGWENTWVCEMDDMIDRYYKILNFDGSYGVQLRDPRHTRSFHFPYFVLEKDINFELPSELFKL